MPKVGKVDIIKKGWKYFNYQKWIVTVAYITNILYGIKLFKIKLFVGIAANQYDSQVKFDHKNVDLEWKPAVGEKFYIVVATLSRGFAVHSFKYQPDSSFGGFYMQQIIKNNICFRKKEAADLAVHQINEIFKTI